MKPLLPIYLSAKRKSWRMADDHASEHDTKFQEVRKSVLDRDDYSCRFCNFHVNPTKKGASYQDVHHIDDDHSNNKEDNLVTACCLCHQCFHLGLAGAKRGGVLIYLPEISQADLHHLCRAIFVAIATNSKYSDNARSLFAALESRQMHIEEHLGRGASNPTFLGQAFMTMTAEQYNDRMNALDGVRLLPYPDRFQDQIEFWISHVFKDMHPDSWDQILGSFVDQYVPQQEEPEQEVATEDSPSEGVASDSDEVPGTVIEEDIAEMDLPSISSFDLPEEIQVSEDDK